MHLACDVNPGDTASVALQLEDAQSSSDMISELAAGIMHFSPAR